MMDPWRRMIRRYGAVGGARAALLEDGRDTVSLMKRARLVWSRFLAFCYVDDAYALSELLGNRPHQLADVLRTAGSLLLGAGAWSISKVREDGFFAWLHKFTGIVIDTSNAPNVMVSFTSDRLQKMKDLLLTVD